MVMKCIVDVDGLVVMKCIVDGPEECIIGRGCFLLCSDESSWHLLRVNRKHVSIS